MLLCAKGLNKNFKTDHQEVAVIRDLDFDVAKGEFAVIMGSSGSGKSSLLYLLSGLDKACSGSIRIDQAQIDQLNEEDLAKFRRAGLGFVFQDANLIPHLSILENIMIAGHLKGASAARAQQLLEMVGIGHLRDRLPSQTSGGEQQRASIARALINDPQVLLADEPTGNLNSANSEHVLDLFNDIHQQGQTIVLVTHELKAACRGDVVHYMNDGNIQDRFHFENNSATLLREKALFSWLSERGW